jgi:hypothetical protein
MRNRCCIHTPAMIISPSMYGVAAAQIDTLPAWERFYDDRHKK